MQHNHTFREFLNRNLYLLIIAAWMITFAIIIDNYWSANSSLKSVRKKLTSYINESENDLQRLVKDTKYLNAIKGGTYDEETVEKLIAKPYFVFFYKIDSSGVGNPILWNTQKILPSSYLLYKNEKSSFEQLQNGSYVLNTFQIDGMKILALIPVKWKYIIENKNLSNDFAAGSISDEYDVTTDSLNNPVLSVYGNRLFDVVKMHEASMRKNNIIATWLIVAAFALIFFFIHLFSNFIASNYGAWKGIVFLFLSLIIIRLLAYWYPFPINFRQFELYSPEIYGANRFLRSLGDLLMHSLFFVWFVLFLRTHIKEQGGRLFKTNIWLKVLFLTIGSITIILIGFTCIFTIRSLVADSQISFDVTNFFTLNIYSIVGFLILCCIAIGFYFLCQIIIQFLSPYFKTSIPILLGIALCGLFFLSFRIGRTEGAIDVYYLLWLLLFVYLLNNDYFYLVASRIISSRLVFWLFFFSASIAAVIIYQNNRKELEDRKLYAESRANKSDPSSQYLLNSMLSGFRGDYLTRIINRLKSPELSKEFKDSLSKNAIQQYQHTFTTTIYSFDENNKSLYNGDSTSYDELNTIYNTQAKPTEVPSLLYYDVSYDRYKYISKKEIKDLTGQAAGTMFIVISPIKDRTDALTPELFDRGNDNAIENSSDYAVAIYKNWKLINSSNDYPFETSIRKDEFPNQEFFYREVENFSEQWYNKGGGRMVAIARKNSLALESITLFSYLFCGFLLLTFLFWLINILLATRFQLRKMKVFWQLSIRHQIHGTIIFISVLSFFVIGIATIMFFVRRYNNNNREELSKAIGIIRNEVRNYPNPSKGSYKVSFSDQLYGSTLEEIIRKISEVHGKDMNIYDLKGNLRISSLRYAYENYIISSLMEPMAYYHLNNKNQVQFFQHENIGKLKYISNYSPVIDNEGNKYAYLNIPYFISQRKLRAEISNFLITIINLNAFIFLIAGIVSLFITNRITKSFSLIANKMRRINIGQRNEAIVWTRNDEIGELVNEYNKMVSKLEDSAQSLAKTERESAWREMAKQIAHEIKNPLTPMKLSMQYLQKSIEQNHPDIQRLAISVSHTLVEQIDHLSHIASEFSQFANIENSRKEHVNLNDELMNVLNLYKSDSRLTLNISLISKDIKIEADRTHLNRVFNNLLQNALQSSTQKKMTITVKEIMVNEEILISIRDTGSGIKKDIRDKIFTPNFTTKSSGTGLGLAMSKRMVEHAQGTIWFETEEGTGTVFFLKFPVTKV